MFNILVARMAQWIRYLDYLTTHTSLSPIRHGFAPCFVNYKKGCTLLAAASDKAYQLLDHGRWFSTGTLASFTTKTGGHDIAESGIKHNKSINQSIFYSKLIDCILFKIIVQNICFMKGRGTSDRGEINSKILLAFRKSPRFSFTLSLGQLKEKSSRLFLLSVVSPDEFSF